MANAVLGQVAYEPIQIWRVDQGAGFPQMQRALESATQTFKPGVPLTLSSGYLIEAAFSSADIVYGISAEPAHNLAVSGTAEQGTSEGTAQNQTSSRIIPAGAWMKDGKVGVYQANAKNIFSISLKAAQVFTQALIVNPATLYGLTKDSTTGFWYLDNTDTSGNNAVAVLLGVDPSCPNTAAGGCRVFFQFAATKRFWDVG